MRLPSLKQLSVVTLVGTATDWIVRGFDLWSADYKGVWKTTAELLKPAWAAMSIDAVVILGSLAVFLFAQYGDRVRRRLGYPPSNTRSRPEAQSLASSPNVGNGKAFNERLEKLEQDSVQAGWVDERINNEVTSLTDRMRPVVGLSRNLALFTLYKEQFSILQEQKVTLAEVDSALKELDSESEEKKINMLQKLKSMMDRTAFELVKKCGAEDPVSRTSRISEEVDQEVKRGRN